MSAAMLVLAGLGVDPWDVLHQGLSRSFGLGIGTWVIVVSAAVLALWWPLRQRPGFGTLSNALLVGLVMDAGLGAGPRDGLTLGFCARTGASIRLVRTAIEATVLLVGWRLGGTVGIGTVAYALAIGPITHVTIPALTWRATPRCPPRLPPPRSASARP